MKLSRHQWIRLVASTVVFAILDILWTLFAFGKSTLLSWRGWLGVAVLSTFFFLIAAWWMSTLHPHRGE
ncbi:hypothetical protein B1526_0229 [Bifidobacterium criceti]|uniref:Uncharacterized protein n=1 Tax=Bifidobacterium criceti TaxID=1960969 RepID=A0A2A2EIB2_9BIFI|nr:hypothetical protein B1526_0229 [Bifidobacterium criceti]